MEAPTRLSLGRNSSLARGTTAEAEAEVAVSGGAGAGAGAGAKSCLPKETLRVDCVPGVHDTDVGVGAVIPEPPKSTYTTYYQQCPGH